MTTHSRHQPERDLSGIRTKNRNARELFYAMCSLIRDGKTDELGLLLAPDFRLTMPGTTNASLGETQEMFSQWSIAFPDFMQTRGDYDSILSDNGTRLFCFDSQTVTHSGPFTMPGGQIIPPTGRKAVIDAAHFVLVRDGLVVSWRIILDTGILARQLRGELPPGQQEESQRQARMRSERNK